ncbi:hypothetical protein [Glycomyces dulcitolivorans]|uniref:hypothetical protein n=1 Tax=Glycomyces dulcitolivorans TaxID=2200759 RepID=UPI000DD31D1E|nr:hypothetical protein [Glycomyces dulcitolivorans]
MQPQDDTGTLFRQARPDTTPQEASLDLDSIMRDGYRARRRNRAVLGGATTVGVAAVAAVLAFSVGVLNPGKETDRPQDFPAGEGFAFDPSMAGYPSRAPDVWDDRQPELNEALQSAFGPLAIDSGFLDADALDSERPTDEEITAEMEASGGYYSALSELGYHNLPLVFDPFDTMSAAGQVYLRGLIARDGNEEIEWSSFTITAMAPGGWSSEPGPGGEDPFPQHLISDAASWSDEAPVFTTEELDDGRTLMVADHGCALEALVVYPNDSALRSEWDLDCEGQGREMTVEALTDAMLSMPQIDWDTSELVPVDELLDIPPGPEWDGDWEVDAEEDMQASVDAAIEAIDAAHPGTYLTDAAAGQSGEEWGPVRREYVGSMYLPYPFHDGYDVSATVMYHLPGGWLPGLPPEGTTVDDPYLVDCGGPGDDKDDVCEETEVDGRTVATRSWCVDEEQCSYWVLVFDPAGWAVEFSVMYAGSIEELAYEELIALTASLPAPVYDPAEYGQD